LDTIVEEGVQEVVEVHSSKEKSKCLSLSDFSPLDDSVPATVCVLLKELMVKIRSAACSSSDVDLIIRQLEEHAAAEGASVPSLLISTWLSTPHSLEQLETPLHVASQGGLPGAVLALLRGGASPMATDIRDRFPYFLAKDKETRDAFRIYRGEAEESEQSDKWDWSLCGIPTALTNEILKDKKEKEKEKKKKAKQRKQATKQEMNLKEQMEEKAKQEALAMQEAINLKNLKIVGFCSFCEKSLAGIVPLDVFDRRCCSSACVVQMRRKLTAEAAEKRLQKLDGKNKICS